MTQEKKANKVVIVLAIICVILCASTISSVALYLSNQTQVTEKDQTIFLLHEQIAALQLQISQTPNVTEYTTQIATLNAQIANLNSSLVNMYGEYANLESIVALSKYGTLYNSGFIQEANTKTALYSNTLLYAGYILVQATSNTSSTYAQVSFIFNEYTFEYNQTLGLSGNVVFPILPGSIILEIGNLEEVDSNSVNATAVYYY